MSDSVLLCGDRSGNEWMLAVSLGFLWYRMVLSGKNQKRHVHCIYIIFKL